VMFNPDDLSVQQAILEAILKVVHILHVLHYSFVLYSAPEIAEKNFVRISL